MLLYYYIVLSVCSLHVVIIKWYGIRNTCVVCVVNRQIKFASNDRYLSQYGSTHYPDLIGLIVSGRFLIQIKKEEEY